MQEIEQAKANFQQAKERLVRAFEATPDDRVNWSPAPSARTAIHLVAHSAWATKSIHDQLKGNAFEVASTDEADKQFREWEVQFTSREQALELLEKNCGEYETWLDTLTPEKLNAVVKLPFNLGEAPVSIGLTFVPMHLNYHIAQLDYLQTTYGDRVWR